MNFQEPEYSAAKYRAAMLERRGMKDEKTLYKAARSTKWWWMWSREDADEEWKQGSKIKVFVIHSIALVVGVCLGLAIDTLWRYLGRWKNGATCVVNVRYA
jgi:hypothetical protein